MGDEAPLNETAIIHLYRGELGRMTAYRVRLDNTTNWAFGANAAILSIGLGSDVHHSVFALAVLLNLAFVWMEARRFRGYEMIQRRVRLLETGYFVEQVGGRPAADWKRDLAASLASPKPPSTYLQSASVRLRRNFLLLIVLDYAGWLFMLDHAGGIPDGAATLGVSGMTVMVFAAVVFTALVALSLYHFVPEEG